MKTRTRRRPELTCIALALATAGFLAGPAVAQEETAPIPAMYVMDFLATAATGEDMNDAGVAIGERSIDVGCGFECLAPVESGVWTRDGFSALPVPPGFDTVRLAHINANGWVVGTVLGETEIRAAVWKPVGEDYEVVLIEPTGDADTTEALGIDDQNRVVGYSFRFSPQATFSFVWSEAEGPVELTDLGFPNDLPQAISPAGTVAYLYGWYELDVPGVIHLNADPPDGFRGPGAYFEINDAGDQIRLLGPTSGQNINYPFRYYNSGQWQQIHPSGGIDASPFGVGTITDNLDIVLTISSTGLLAVGPAQEAELLTDRLSPAYGDASVSEAVALTEAGEILADVTIGRSKRLMRMVEGVPCTTNCMVVSRLQLQADFVDDPDDPGRCVGTAHTRAQARIRVVDESGRPLESVQVTGHFLDDYWLDDAQVALTDNRGSARFRFRGPPCTGAMAFLVSDAVQAGRSFDRTVGTLQGWVIPQ